ncbi:hypothetical protein Chor_006525 [Crotalus horridus]
MIMAEQQLSKVLDEKLEENEKTAPLEWTFKYDGVLYTTMTSCLETLKRINTFRAREDDIKLVAYPKSGSWLCSPRFYIYMSIYHFALKILALFRNPKDTAVSYFHFFKGITLISDHETWDEFLEAFITGKGIVGDWTSAFSESQSERMDRKFEKSVAKTKLGMMLKYEMYCKN